MIKIAPSKNAIKGFDVSSYQPHFNFQKAKDQGFAFCFLKATEGVHFLDKSFMKHWANAKEAGLIVGAYHFFHPSSPAMQQADHFCDTVGLLTAGDLPCVLDWETTDGVPTAADAASGLVFLNRVKQRTGKDPIVYGGPYFLDALRLSQDFKNYPLWIAHYGTKAPLVPGPWKMWSFWQYSEDGLDYNLFNGSMEQLLKIAHG